MIFYFVDPATAAIYTSYNASLARYYESKGFKKFSNVREAEAYVKGLAIPFDPVKEEPEAPEITPQDAVIAEMSEARRESALPRNKKKKLVK